MVMNFFQMIFEMLKQYGFIDFLFPWLLFSALIYGILQSKKYISEEVSVNGTISIALAFLITYFGRGEFFSKIFWLGGVLLTGILLALLFGSMLGVDVMSIFGDNKSLAWGALIVGVLIVIFVFSMERAWKYIGLSGWTISGPIYDFIMFIIILGVMIGLVYYIFKD